MSSNKKINIILKCLGENINNIDLYLNDVLKREYKILKEEEIKDFFKEYLETFYNNHSIKDGEAIRLYTGKLFSPINSILRNYWDGDKNGILTTERKEYINEVINHINKILKSLYELPNNIIVYRGVNIDTFKSYGINTIEDLVNLKDELYYENGFTSTSLLKENSYFGKELEFDLKSNIEIEYLIPKEYNEGLPLITDELSYDKNIYEFLINKGSLAKIVDVNISDDKKYAYIKMVLIPRKVYEIDYKEENKLLR